MLKAYDLPSSDPALAKLLAQENKRQLDHIELIASENYASANVMALQGSILTNKYAEGYPGKRYYAGCEHVDTAEDLAIERLKQLFGADYANVQPHSGSQANQAALMALIQPGDTILGMGLPHGGHLTHGCSVNQSGKHYNAISYGLNEEGNIDYAQVEALAQEHKPQLIITGFSAYSGLIDWQRFRDIADSVGAYMLADIAHVSGLVATGLYPSPIQIADVVTTTTHKTLRGPRGGVIMAKENPELAKRLNSAVFPGMQGGPLMHVIAAKAAAFQEALQDDFTAYQRQVITNAQTMAKVLIQRGIDVVSGGTHNHMFLVDLTKQDITGKLAEERLLAANITLNKNTVPGETRSPFVTSGLRIGTPAVTTRGLKEKEVTEIANWIVDILEDIDNEALIQSIKEKGTTLCQRFPVYPADMLLNEA